MCLLSHYCARMLQRWGPKAKGAITAFCHSTNESTSMFSPTLCNCTYFYQKGRLAMETSCVLFFWWGGECRWFVKLVVSVWLLMRWCIWLQDDDPYVRKTAAVCVAKISDSNPMVVANAVAALAEIQEGSSKNVFEITNHTLFKLLAALNECTEYDPSCFCQYYKLSCLWNWYWY